jgi:hypothetical protein
MASPPRARVAVHEPEPPLREDERGLLRLLPTRRRRLQRLGLAGGVIRIAPPPLFVLHGANEILYKGVEDDFAVTGGYRWLQRRRRRQRLGAGGGARGRVGEVQRARQQC